MKGKQLNSFNSSKENEPLAMCFRMLRKRSQSVPPPRILRTRKERASTPHRALPSPAHTPLWSVPPPRILRTRKGLVSTPRQAPPSSAATSLTTIGTEILDPLFPDALMIVQYITEHCQDMRKLRAADLLAGILSGESGFVTTVSRILLFLAKEIIASPPFMQYDCLGEFLEFTKVDQFSILEVCVALLKMERREVRRQSTSSTSKTIELSRVKLEVNSQESMNEHDVSMNTPSVSRQSTMTECQTSLTRRMRLTKVLDQHSNFYELQSAEQVETIKYLIDLHMEACVETTYYGDPFAPRGVASRISPIGIDRFSQNYYYFPNEGHVYIQELSPPSVDSKGTVAYGTERWRCVGDRKTLTELISMLVRGGAEKALASILMRKVAKSKHAFKKTPAMKINKIRRLEAIVSATKQEIVSMYLELSNQDLLTGDDRSFGKLAHTAKGFEDVRHLLLDLFEMLPSHVSQYVVFVSSFGKVTCFSFSRWRNRVLRTTKPSVLYVCAAQLRSRIALNPERQQKMLERMRKREQREQMNQIQLLLPKHLHTTVSADTHSLANLRLISGWHALLRASRAYKTISRIAGDDLVELEKNMYGWDPERAKRELLSLLSGCRARMFKEFPRKLFALNILIAKLEDKDDENEKEKEGEEDESLEL